MEKEDDFAQIQKVLSEPQNDWLEQKNALEQLKLGIEEE